MANIFYNGRLGFCLSRPFYIFFAFRISPYNICAIGCVDFRRSWDVFWLIPLIRPALSISPGGSPEASPGERTANINSQCGQGGFFMKELLQKGAKVRFVRDVSNQTGEYAPKNALGVVTFSHVIDRKIHV